MNKKWFRWIRIRGPNKHICCFWIRGYEASNQGVFLFFHLPHEENTVGQIRQDDVLRIQKTYSSRQIGIPIIPRQLLFANKRPVNVFADCCWIPSHNSTGVKGKRWKFLQQNFLWISPGKFPGIFPAISQQFSLAYFPRKFTSKSRGKFPSTSPEKNPANSLVNSPES